MPRSLAEWLEWQESLNPAEIDLRLDRVSQVAAKLPIAPPPGAVFVVAGTNGKGSCSAFLGRLLARGGFRTGIYSSPHLVRYNERVVVAGQPAEDAELIAAFEQIESARGAIELTFFEFGTLAAWLIFTRRECTAWVLEVGLGGRLDAVNAIDNDCSIVTTVDIDHQAWLGDTIEAIAAEKAGVMRTGRIAIYGDSPVPSSLRGYAAEIGARLLCLGEDYTCVRKASCWDWHGQALRLADLPFPVGQGDEQLRNMSAAFAALERFDPGLLSDSAAVREEVANFRLPGRFQRHRDAHEWIIDVAHNRQSAAALTLKLRSLPGSTAVTVVIGMFADKQIGECIAELAPVAECWIACSIPGPRGCDAAELAGHIAPLSAAPVYEAAGVESALRRAREVTPVGGRILVCGSFRVAGPAIELLGLY